MFPLLHRENSALGTLFAFWQLCEITFSEYVLTAQQQEEEQQEQQQEQQLRALVSLVFPAAFHGSQRVGFKDFEAALQRVGCPARRSESVSAWLLLSGAQQQQQLQLQQGDHLLEQQREAAASSAYIDGTTLLRRAKVLPVHLSCKREQCSSTSSSSRSSSSCTGFSI